MIKKILLSLMLIASLTACQKVSSGHVGIKVYLLGGSKGVDSETLGVGRYWIGINEELFIFPTFMQTREWKDAEAIAFQTKDGMNAAAPIGVSYTLEREKIPEIFQTYRKGIEEITDIYVRNTIRDSLVKAASSQRIEYIYGEGKVELLQNVEADVREQLAPRGIIINKLYYTGQIGLPEAIVNAINMKVNADQITAQKTAELQQVRADGDKAVAEAEAAAKARLARARSEAEANRLIAQSISPELVNYQAMLRWNGILPTTMVPGSAVPMIELNQ